MPFKLKSDLINDVITLLSQVPGVSVQTYSEDRIGLLLDATFNIAFKKAYWAEYKTTFTAVTLDGTSGAPTTDLSSIKELGDLQFIFRTDSDRHLPRLSDNKNPASLTGTSARYYDGDPVSTTNVFKIYPITATDTLTVKARIHPGTLLPTTIIKIDELYMTFLTVWQYLEDDESNPGAAEKYRLLASDRFNQIVEDENDDVIELDSRSDLPPTEWEC